MVQKSADAFRTISEVATTLELPAHVLRFWESRFTQIKPVKRGGGRRYYRPQDIRLLRGIRDLLYADGESIKDVQKLLREKGTRHVASIGSKDEPTQPAPKPAPKLEVIARKVEPAQPPVEPQVNPETLPVIEVETVSEAIPQNAQFDLFEDYMPPVSNKPTSKPASKPKSTPRRKPVADSTRQEIRLLFDQLVTLRDDMKAQD